MRKYFWLVAVTLFMVGNIPAISSAAQWGKDYFPNPTLTTHEGKKVKFFDDLIKDKIVAINFIYTNCPDTCPLETAQLVRVAKILGDRVGKDVFFYTISIDPERDTPAVMADYRRRFKANWTFLTGDKEEIIEIRKALGLYLEEIQDGSYNHNVSLIIGNQKTGRWMKRSPTENVALMADQLGNWLTGWKGVQTADSYENAPDLRSIPRGEEIFRTRCSTCHTLTGKEPKDALGPDLIGLSDRRNKKWIYDWLQAPDKMIKDKDPIALALLKQYNNLQMPNMRLIQADAESVLDYVDSETRRFQGLPELKPISDDDISVIAAKKAEKSGDVLAVMNAWVREAFYESQMNAGYMVLINVGKEDVTLAGVESEAFKSVEIHQMLMVNGLMEMKEDKNIVIPPGAQLILEPGARHLMMMGRKHDLKVGDKVDITLTFKSGKKQKLTVNVDTRNQQ